MLPPPSELPKPRGTATDMLAAKGHVVHAIGPKDTVYDAVHKMNEVRVGALVVMEDDELVGIISERDYTRKVVLLSRQSRETRVEEIMTPQVVTITPQTSLAECLHIVNHRSIRHLPVVEGGRVVGVLSVGDLVRAILAQQMETIENLNAFIGGDYPN